jgi:hypothetical protein
MHGTHNGNGHTPTHSGLPRRRTDGLHVGYDRLGGNGREWAVRFWSGRTVDRREFGRGFEVVCEHRTNGDGR